MHARRKDEHIKYALKQRHVSNDFDLLQLKHLSIPRFDLADVNLETNILGQKFALPFYINAMTGGTRKTTKLNYKLAALAKHYNIPFFLGSQSIMLKNPALQSEYAALRAAYPDLFIVANVNANATVEQAKTAVRIIKANALAIHVNSVQELTMAEGDRAFKQWLPNIKKIVNALKIPVIVKEVGNGMYRETIIALAESGVTYIDISGAGGTDFTKIELARNRRKSSPLTHFKLSTVNALIDAQNVPNVIIHASGGIRNSLDIVKALSLNAAACGLARYFLALAKLNFKNATKQVDELIVNLKKTMVLVGAQTINELNDTIIY